MTLEQALENFKEGFVSVPVTNVRYLDELEMYIGEVIMGDQYHPKDSSIAFEFFDGVNETMCVAYKPLTCYHK